eukprot:jgi/Botrbrau1/22893/Bobra.0065s0046.1
MVHDPLAGERGMHPLQPSPVYSWEAPSSKRVTDAPPGPDGLRVLALQGGWSAILERTRGYATSAKEDIVVYASWHILALYKLGRYSAAAEELANLGDLESLASGEGSIPFVLRWIHTHLAGRLGGAGELRERLYKLLNFCNVELHDAWQPPPGSSLEQAAQQERGWRQLWLRRRHMTLFSLASHHAGQGEWVLSLRWLNTVLRERDGDPSVWLKVGYVQLMMGDADSAAASFAKAAGGADSASRSPGAPGNADSAASSGPQVAGTAESVAAFSSRAGGNTQQETLLARRCNALVAFAKGDFPGAAAELDLALEEGPADAEALNNRAICQLYQTDLTGAVQVLEDALQQGGREVLREPLLRNLSCMYDLYSAGRAAASKSRLTAWASGAGPEDLDLSEVRATTV